MLKENYEKTREYQANYRENHVEERREYSKKYNLEHREELTAYGNVYSSIRRAKILAATIGDVGEIKEIYRQAREDEGIICYLCGEVIPLGQRHVDHVVPITKGGAHSVENLRITHSSCNFRKHNKLVEELSWAI